MLDLSMVHQYQDYVYNCYDRQMLTRNSRSSFVTECVLSSYGVGKIAQV